jgi:hypothetical protein
MSTKKTNNADTAVKLGPLDLERENDELLKQMELLTQQVIKAEDRYIEEREKRREVQSINAGLKDKVQYLSTQLEAAQGIRAVEKSKRHGSIPKFVIVAAIALVVLMASFLLQKLSAIGPSVGYGIQCTMSMVISWCYAIIYDRSRNN